MFAKYLSECIAATLTSSFPFFTSLLLFSFLPSYSVPCPPSICPLTFTFCLLFQLSFLLTPSILHFPSLSLSSLRSMYRHLLPGFTPLSLFILPPFFVSLLPHSLILIHSLPFQSLSPLKSALRFRSPMNHHIDAAQEVT